MKKYLQIVFLIVVTSIISLFIYFRLDIFFSVDKINNVRAYFIGLGNWSILYITLIHIILNITGIPRVFFTIFAGYVYGILIGFIYSWFATMAGLIVTFIMVRYLFRQSFEERFGSKKIVEKINRQIEKHGIWTVIFLRAIYVVPSSVLNYSFGFTKIKTSTYLMGSAIGFLPVVLINVWAGNALANQIKYTDGINLPLILIGVLFLGLFLFAKKTSVFQKISGTS